MFLNSKSKIRLICGLLCLLLFASQSFAKSLHPFDRVAQEPRLFSKLQQFIKATVAKSFGKAATLPELNEEIWKSPSVPLFITAKKSDQIRGCMGSLQAQQLNMAEEIQITLQKAFAQDPRHAPIAWEEAAGMEIFLTAVGEPQAIHSLKHIDPLYDAVLIKSGSKEAVILAGEAKTQSYLEKLARAKAGIPPQQDIQVFKLPTKVLKVSLPKK